MTIPISIAEIYFKASNCSLCFDQYSNIERTYIDKPQPRYIGPNYYSSSPRIAIMMINPGEGNPILQSTEKDLLDNFAGSSTDYVIQLKRYFNNQRQNMEKWGSGAFKKYFEDIYEFKLDRLAFINLAWCATKEDKYPRPMLNNCFRVNTSKLLVALDPDILLLSGTAVQKYRYMIKGYVPKTRIIDIYHYANRKPLDYVRNQAIAVKRLIADKG